MRSSHDMPHVGVLSIAPKAYRWRQRGCSTASPATLGRLRDYAYHAGWLLAKLLAVAARSSRTRALGNLATAKRQNPSNLLLLVIFVQVDMVLSGCLFGRVVAQWMASRKTA